jgi:Mrp family chromosome partitioning ATPase
MAAVSQAEQAVAPAGAPKNAAAVVPQVPDAMLAACRAASLLIAGPSLSRLGVTSALRGEGRTSIAMAMASVQRNDYNRSVALLDMDFENPALVRRYGCEAWPGLAEVARGKATIDKVMQPVAERMSVVPGGLIAASTARTVADILKADLVSELERRVDIVIVDLPPLLGSGSGPTAARAVESLLLVVRAGVTPVARIREATADLHVTPAVVLNGSYSNLPRWLRRLGGR